MDPIHITLPDGKVQEVPKGTTPADIAREFRPASRMQRWWRA